MARVAYSEDYKLRVLAIASVRGLSHACKQFGVTSETVRAWQAERPDDDKLKLAADLALSELTVEIAEGKGRSRLATHAGILMDKVARYYKPKEPEPVKTEAETWGDELMAALEARLTSDEVDIALDALVRQADEQLRAVERGEITEATGVELDIPATVAWVESLGDLESWNDRQRQEQHDEIEAQLEANRQAAAEWKQRSLDEETRALIAKAEAFLAETAA